MSNNPAVAVALLAVLAAIFIWILYVTNAQCHADGGTTVRGLIWLECIK
jgi:hypothetical protein